MARAGPLPFPLAAEAPPPDDPDTSALRELVAAGTLSAGAGVLKVMWWGVELPPSAGLRADGAITLPDGVGEQGATYTPTALLTFLARHNRLFGFTKGNGMQAVTYQGKRLAEWRALAWLAVAMASMAVGRDGDGATDGGGRQGMALRWQLR